MATVTWVSGSTKNWSDGTAWDTGTAPTAADDAVISGTGTLTIDGVAGTPNVCRSATFTGFTGTLTHATGKELDIGDGTTGHLVLVSGMTYAPSATSLIKFVSTTTGNQTTTGTKRIGSWTFDGVGGGWTFQDAHNFVSGATVTLTNGALNTNSVAVGATSGAGLSSSNSNTRSLTLGTTTWTLASAQWDIGTSTNMTLSAASSTITKGSGGSILTFQGGGLTYGTLSVTQRQEATNTITGANTFGTLSISSAASILAEIGFSDNQTVTGTFTLSGNSTTNRILAKSSTIGTQVTITAATITATYSDWRDIVGAGAASWDLSAITGGSGNGGNCSGITFTTAANQYWFKNTGNWNTTANWFLGTGGTGGAGRIPLLQDTAIFDASSFDTGSQTVTLNMRRFPTVNWTGVTNTPAWAKTTETNCFGNVTLVSGMTNSGTADFYFSKSNATQSFTSAGLTWTNPLRNDNGTLSTTTLADALTSSNTIRVTTGNLITTAAVTCTALAPAGGTLTLGAAISPTTTTLTTGGTVALGSYNITGSAAMTFQEGTITGTGTISGTTITFSGADVTLNALNCTISGSTITINGAGSTYNVKTVTGTGAITATTGTLNHSGTITANTNCAIVPVSSNTGGGGIFNSSIIRAA